jgi:dTDP-4-amino-4,6-dideoxygalactose transaminase
MTGAFDRRRLTNQGPLVAELEQQLRELHRTKHAVTFANACFALLLAARFLARPGARKVLMPAFTFRGLPHLLRWAGLEPEYCDVDPIYHTLAPDAVARSIGPDVALVLAVDNVSALCDIDALEAVTRAAQVPLLLDSVYGIGGHYAGDPVGSRGDAAVFSLHATKLINGFEGGYLTTNDDALATALQKDRNFGFDADGIAHGWSLNAKLNEIHAALALSNLPHLDRIIADNHTRFAAYQQALSGIPWLGFADYSRSPGNYGLCLLRVDATAPYTRNELIRILRNENALVRPYYSPPLHRTVGPDQGHFALPVTDNLAGVFIQMPVGDQVSVDDIHRLGDFFRQLHREQSVIVPRLRSLVCE